MQDQITTLLTQQAVLLTEMKHVRELVEKQNGRVGKLEERCTTIEGRVTNTEKDDIRQKSWMAGVAAGIGAVAAIGVDKFFKLFEKVPL
jgi:hypothetical protein